MRWEEKKKLYSFEAWRRAFDINEPIYSELCHEFHSTYDFDEVVTNDEFMTKKLIKFRLGGRGHTLTLLEFARRLGSYYSAEISDGGFEVYFQGDLRSDENFNAMDYWLSIISEEELHLSRSLASSIRSLILRHQNGYANVAWLIARWLKRKGVESQRDSMICCGQFIMRITRRMRLLTDDVLDGLSAPTYCRALDAATLKELICFNGRMGRIEIRQGELERMSRRQLYHTDNYAGVFEFMAGHYEMPLHGVYVPPSYKEQQHEDEE
ncbi:hypothetical protein Tco_1083052 [Tanacetum coccineum]|uniref:Uncharacterized protein n=1 Tax=Tanacetum coccineum TaxID=301880 RepID=A0ABQ5I4D1_9ASTR